jgi:5-methyltetrahydropteroyltriglutamate--homocysteine methyltransferase
METPYRAEVIGSLLRPAYLIEARTKFEEGQLDEAELKLLEDQAVKEVLALQEDAGVDVVTDGEMRRFTFIGPLTESLDGIENVPGVTFRWYGDDTQTDFQNTLSVTGRLARHRYLAADEYGFAAGLTTKPVKATIPSPLMLSLVWNPERSPTVYADPFELFEDATRLVREEAERLAALGCTYVQIDAPELATLVDERQWPLYESIGAPPDRMLAEGVDLLNQIPGIDGVTFGLHLCRGNNAGMWMSEGGYEKISRQVFGRADRYDRYLLEYDDYRSGSFEPLADVADGKVVVLGLVSSKRPELEDHSGLIERIDDAARYFPKEQLALSTQCGFASILFGNQITEEDERDKLRLVADVAHEVWS